MYAPSPPAPDEVLVPPVYDDSELMHPGVSWQLLSVSLRRTPSIGFGIAVSGGIDNPHFTSGEPAVVISAVVSNGPAFGLLQVNDRILSANGISFENIEYAKAVDIIKLAENINMIVKRRVAMPVMEFEQRTLKFTLTKSRKKDDFGIVLGCKFYIKEIRNPRLAEKDPGLREGDSVLRVNGQSVDGASLEDVTKWLDRSREKLCLVIQRDVRRGTTRWPSTQTVYERLGSVAATPRHSPSPIMHQPLSSRSSHEYMNSPSWRGGPSSENGESCLESRRMSSPAVSASPDVPQPSSHRDYDYYSRGQPRPDDRGVRSVCFNKVGGSVGVRVVGGNDVGIFVSAVAADSAAAEHGVCCGDRILEVNGRSLGGVTRETAVQLLLSLEDRVYLKLEHARTQFEAVRQSQIGDNFFIRAHFTKEKKSSDFELTINEGDIFHVTDTLFGGTVGLWQASRVYSATGRPDSGKGVIPNLATAESYAREARRVAEQRGNSKGTLLRRKLESRRTKSLPKNLLTDPTEFAANLPLPAYERVALNTPSFHRPLVMFGPLADVARRLLLSQFALRFGEAESEGGVIRLAAVDSVIAAGKHCILDISIESVERLQLAQYAPIVLLIDVEGRSRIRELRRKLDAPKESSRKLAEQAAAIKKHHSHLLSATVDATQEEGWFEALRDLIAHLQQRRLWMPEFPPSLPLEDLLLFSLSKSTFESDSEASAAVPQPSSEYADYTRKNEDLTRSIYEWQSTVPVSSPSIAPASGRFSSLPRRTLLEQQQSDVSGRSQPGMDKKTAPSQQPFHSLGYFNVKQLLNDDNSTYVESQLVDDMNSARLRPNELGKDLLKEREGEDTREREDREREMDRRTLLPPATESAVRKATEEMASGSNRNCSSSERPAVPAKPFNDKSHRSDWREKPVSTGVPSPLLDPPQGPSRPMASPEGAASSRQTTPPYDVPATNGGVKEDEDEPVVLEQTSRVIGAEGGSLSCPASNVQLLIPPGAIPAGERHEIYVKVCEDGGSGGRPPVDEGRGEQLLSPLVMCGPPGLSFLLPLELRLPHSAGEKAGDEWKFSLKTADGGQWKHLDVTPHCGSSHIALAIHNF